MKKISNKNLKSYYMYGIHPVISALRNPKRNIIKLFVTDENFKLYKDLIQNKNYEIVEKKFFLNILPKDSIHQGIAILVDKLTTDSLKDFLHNNSLNTKISILDQITDPHNIGAIIRSAAAFGIKAIIIPEDNSLDENAIIAKTSSGTLEFVNLIKVKNIVSSVKLLKNNNYWIIGLDGNTKKTIYDHNLTGNLCFILGSEGSGIRRLVKENCDLLVKIPINPEVESLNVSNAASIVFSAHSNFNF